MGDTDVKDTQSASRTDLRLQIGIRILRMHRKLRIDNLAIID